MKFYIQSEDILFDNNKWICDSFKDEFIKFANITATENIEESDIIWLLSPWMFTKHNQIKIQKVITTIHHIDHYKYDEFQKYFDNVKDITTYFHVICPKTESDLRKITNKPIVRQNFWINDQVFFHIDNKQTLRQKYNIPTDKFVVGSFQKDTEGKDKCIKPKISKGPDILFNILQDYKDIFVVLTGRRRSYIIDKLSKKNIPYIYLQMVSMQELNELYNCLDLYIVSSRIEGGPRSIMECAINKTPIISTDVGISELILSKESIYDMNDYETYRKAKPNIEYAYKLVNEYTISNNYIIRFLENVFIEEINERKD